MSGFDVSALRKEEFPHMDAGKSIYLNSASTGPLPMRTVAELSDWSAWRRQPDVISWDKQRGALERARAGAAKLIGAGEDEIALTTNTGYGINLAARALPLKVGSTVVTFDGEFPANVYPWMALEKARGVKLERIPLRNGLPDETALIRALDRPEVGAATVSWVQFSSGHKCDIEKIGRACRERGKWFVLDAIQGVGANVLDVRAANVDVLACGGQKWLLSPWGSGFAYVRRELIEQLDPPEIGWLAMVGSDDFTKLVDYDFTLYPDGRRFEMMTGAYQDYAAMASSMELLLSLGVEHIQQHVAELCDRLVKWAQGAPNVKLVTSPDRGQRAGIVCVTPPDAASASERLTKAGVVHSLREGSLRFAAHCFNTMDEIERTIALM